MRRTKTPVTETLTAKCSLVIALLAAVGLLWWFQAVIIPFLFSCFFMYLIDPVVTCMLKTPTGCADKCHRCFKITHRAGRRIQQEAQSLASPLLPLSSSKARRTISRRSSTFEHTKDDIKGCWLYFVHKATCPRWLAVILALGFSLAIVAIFVLFVVQSCLSLQNEWPRYQQGWVKLQAQISPIFGYFHIDFQTDVEPYLMTIFQRWSEAFVVDIVSFIEKSVIVIIFLIYLLMSPIRPRRRGSLVAKIDRQVRRYIMLKSALSFFVGTLVGLILAGLGVELCWLYAAITVICNFVPNVGAVVATLVPLPLVILDSELSSRDKAMAFLLPLAVHMVNGNFLEPKVFGKNLELHPVVVLLALAFWAVLWGVAGMILAVPLIAVLRIVMGHVDHPYAEIVGALLKGQIITYYDTKGSRSERDVLLGEEEEAVPESESYEKYAKYGGYSSVLPVDGDEDMNSNDPFLKLDYGSSTMTTPDRDLESRRNNNQNNI